MAAPLLREQRPPPSEEATWLIPGLGASQLRDSAGFAPDFALEWCRDSGRGTNAQVSRTGPRRYADGMNRRARFLALAVLAAGIVAFLRRPVRPPSARGTWHPAVHRHSHR